MNGPLLQRSSHSPRSPTGLRASLCHLCPFSNSLLVRLCSIFLFFSLEYLHFCHVLTFKMFLLQLLELSSQVRFTPYIIKQICRYSLNLLELTIIFFSFAAEDWSTQPATDDWSTAPTAQASDWGGATADWS